MYLILSIPDLCTLTSIAMEFSIEFYTVGSRWSIRYILGVAGYNFQRNIEFLSLKIVLVLKYSVDHDEMPHYTAFHLGPHCFTKYLFWGIWYSKGQIISCLGVF